MAHFRTEGYNGYSLQYSPFIENKIACSTSANFGLVGNGRLYIINIGVGPDGINVERMYDTQDGLFDCSWSELNENQVVTSSGDGSIKLWDITLPVLEFPIRNWREHGREVFSVHWNLIKKDSIVSGSWDKAIKLWNPELTQSVSTYAEHSSCVYSTIWSPYNPDIFGSASGDQTVKIWDTKIPRSIQTINTHSGEVLSLDWNKYQENVVVTGSVDRTVRVWDLRNNGRELMCLRGHEFAVRRVKCSPHMGNIIASASYDMTMRLWDIEKGNPLVHVHDAHTEFVLGIDFNLYIEGQIATCAWDEKIHILHPPCLEPTPRPMGDPFHKDFTEGAL
ncbi:4356_t:CDS:2 [Acaulospora morrowiae]|uniref:Peroxin-7 n=1 Tax=Acaulospora morrowiae TaxID=94023 RepID=A0A9N8Z9V0_9GLOM|nr:4356_t:CDS:2 [Acaulospora morrowiae]